MRRRRAAGRTGARVQAPGERTRQDTRTPRRSRGGARIGASSGRSLPVDYFFTADLACFAMIRLVTFAYTVSGRMFLVLSSAFLVYGRLSMIFCA